MPLTVVLILVSLSIAYTIRQAHGGLSLQRVQLEQVCMVNDSFGGKPQIPVIVDDKTYYGCCPGCAERIKNDLSVRIATDPLSGAKVDKAKAVTGANDKGNVFYFENEENFEKFAEAVKDKK
ncbi:MAG: hypothetical protein HY097_05955 [Nitrospinae bacterium]|nr:hypothetical protein [Nitrospinota bacterium]MBI3812991.1 hypothetical protein [Nitrospinota bacterium]